MNTLPFWDPWIFHRAAFNAWLALQRRPVSTRESRELHTCIPFEKFSLGDVCVLARRVSEENVALFAMATGDTNPIHLDKEYARSTPFKRCIAHGMLTGSLFSTLFGTEWPGPGAIYLEQSFRFLRPVPVGDMVTAKATVTELLPQKKRVRFECDAFVGETHVIAGSALLQLPY